MEATSLAIADTLVRLITSAQGGQADAQYALADRYHRGAGVVRNDSLAAEWARKAAEQSHAGAQFLLGALYYSGDSVPKDISQAKGLFRLAAEGGDKYGQCWLGILLDHEASQEGNSRKMEEAARWMKASAKQGMPLAEFLLGTMYQEGVGVPKDHRSAIKWLTASAEHQNTDAQALLGTMYLDGEGVSRDRAKAEQWLRSAAENGSVEALNRLAAAYGNGDGLPQSDSLALAMATRSAELGSTRGEFLAGFSLCCKTPSSIPPDEVTAYMWLTLAAEGGYEKARVFLVVLVGELKPPEGAEARRRAVDWRKQHPDLTDH